MKLPPRIKAKPDAMMGKLCIKGTCIPVNLVLEKMDSGETTEQLLDAYPQLNEQDLMVLGAANVRVDVDHQILINQLAQGIADAREGDAGSYRWPQTIGKTILRETVYYIVNASPRPDDAIDAIALSGLKPTYTPCVLLTKGEIREQMGKIIGLPADELRKAFPLLIALLAVCDSRRRREKPLVLAQH